MVALIMLYRICSLPQVAMVAVASIALTACSTAPLSNSISARTNGQDHWSVEGGVMSSGEDFYTRVGYGVSENNDVGLVAETSSYSSPNYGIWDKYALINQNSDFSLALDTGIGRGDDIDYYVYAGPIVSYKRENFEPYASVRYNRIKRDFKMKDPFLKKVTKPLEYDDYVFSTLGLNYWFTPTLALTMNASMIDTDAAGVGLGLQAKF